MKIVSFNVNGLRSRMHQLEAVISAYSPDIIGLQEIKVRDEEFPRAAVEALGYRVSFHGQKAHYGVALMYRREPLRLRLGLPADEPDAPRRFISALFEMEDGGTLRVINGYFPQGENRIHPEKFPAKEKFYADVADYLRMECDPEQHVALMGDFNVAPLDSDIGIGTDNAKRWLKSGKTCFLPEEREWFRRLTAWGLHDSYREIYSHINDRFSWFDYRSRGFESEPKRGLRIDHILVSRPLCDCCRDAGIDYAIRGMEKPSDHCPVWVDLAIA